MGDIKLGRCVFNDGFIIAAMDEDREFIRLFDWDGSKKEAAETTFDPEMFESIIDMFKDVMSS